MDIIYMVYQYLIFFVIYNLLLKILIDHHQMFYFIHHMHLLMFNMVKDTLIEILNLKQ